MPIICTASTGDGYQWAKDAGHTITELFPTEVPITSTEPLIKSRALQGLSLRDVALSVINAKGKKIIEHRGDMIFTHFGLSGPIALRCSQFVVKELKKAKGGQVTVAIDLFPEQTLHALEEAGWQEIKKSPKKTVRNSLKGRLPERLIPIIMEQAKLADHLIASQLSREQWNQLCQIMKHFTLKVNGTLPLEKAFVTGGGVHIKEIHPKTMQSKLMHGLYFCGEILDIHGYTGGYNITAASCTGYVAGKSAAEQSKSQ